MSVGRGTGDVLCTGGLRLPCCSAQICWEIWNSLSPPPPAPPNSFHPGEMGMMAVISTPVLGDLDEAMQVGCLYIPTQR